jgi:hypothetical protein
MGGFALRLPPGWRVETEDDLLITASAPDGEEFVAISPFIAPAKTAPTNCLRKAPRIFPSHFPDGRLTGLRRGARAGEAVGTLRYAGGGRASLLCSLDGRAGMLYALGAPASRFAARRPDLVRLLDSFSFTGGRTVPGKPAQIGITYRSFEDPNEGAFTVEVPAGWEVSGGAARRSSVEVHPQLEVLSPSGDVRLFVGGDDRRTYALPNPTLTATGFPEGSEYSPGYGVAFVVRRYASGREYGAEHAERSLGCERLELTGGGDRPDLAAELGAIYQENGYVTQTLEVGELEFRCDNSPRGGYIFAGTLATESGGLGIWTVEHLHGYRSEPGSEALAKEVLKHIVSSFRLNPDWVASQQQLTGNVSSIVTETNARISETISSTYESRQATLDEIYREWSNATLEQTDVRDPSTGEQFKVESGHNYYWRRQGSSDIVGEDVGERPDVDFELLEEL